MAERTDQLIQYLKKDNLMDDLMCIIKDTVYCDQLFEKSNI